MSNQEPPQYNESNINAAADVGKTLIGGINADKGWILGFIVVVAIIVGSSTYVQLRSIDAQNIQDELSRSFFAIIEENRHEAGMNALSSYTDQMRRSQEIIKALTASVSRDSERAGDAALFAIREQSTSLAEQSERLDPEFIGPMQPENDQ
jgi:hypothetical protein